MGSVFGFGGEGLDDLNLLWGAIVSSSLGGSDVVQMILGTVLQ